ncbi:MAG: AAC(3) family N-acetyltransferase [Planctomycetota bacterium]|nr:AAC(3) family N-acetyltransferase [Planctomycetota bacterium]
MPDLDHDRLLQDLQSLGVETGDTLFIHSSFKSLGKVEGGAGTVVQALESVVGGSGTVLMPSFNLVENDLRVSTWDLDTTPSTVGWLTEFFRQMEGTVRSDHYSHSVAARGHRAEWFTGDHRAQEGMISPWDQLPWGCTYGGESPMLKAYSEGGKILMLGVDYKSSTYMHVVEVMHWNERIAEDSAADYFWIDRYKLGDYWDSLERSCLGKVGNSDCRLFPIKDFVDSCLAAAKQNPAEFFKWWKP